MHTHRLEYAITSSQIQIVAGERQLPAFLAHPNSGGIHPGIVLLGDSQSAALRQIANRLAQYGLYALAPALEVPSPGDPAPDATDATASPAAMASARAAIQVLRTHNHCNGALALIGLSPAASALALRLSLASDHLAAVIVLEAPPLLVDETLHRNSHPLLMLYGGPDTPELRLLQHRFSPTPGKILLRYPYASPSFFHQPENATDQRSVNYAWAHLLAFLERHLDWSRPARSGAL
ncbi:MAG: dienelactone hydrolase family protein [Anaerolineae bacterium]|nr:dienelactone hydrolase family protein [Anaerolineae bacterium]